VDLLAATTQDKKRTFFAAIALALVVSVLAPPVVEAAVQRIRGTVTAKVKDSTGGAINSEAIPSQGLTDVPGSTGAMDVRNFAGGAGLLGVADCGDAPTGPLPNQVEISGGGVITDMILTGTDGTISITSTAVGGGNVPLSKFRVNAESPNIVVDLSNGLGVTAPLKLVTSGTDCNVVVLGHAEL
jgi:hypothetical protein